MNCFGKDAGDRKLRKMSVAARAHISTAGIVCEPQPLSLSTGGLRGRGCRPQVADFEARLIFRYLRRVGGPARFGACR